MVVLNMEQDMEVLSKLTEDQKVAFMKAFFAAGRRRRTP